MTDYYESHFQAYAAETFFIDPESFLGPFVRRLAPGARVLDVGCGSGRDLLWLKQRGFRPVGFERSRGMAALAREASGCEVIEGDFETYDFSGASVDAVLLSGALVHIPRENLGPALENISRAFIGCNPSGGGPAGGGRLYASLKEGTGSFIDRRGRAFYLWRDGALRALFARLGMEVRHFLRSPSVDSTGRFWLGYVLAPGGGSGVES
ncbi:class I SAM-dependent methyltransferase [Desulfococcus sp.]|uniref:class I SAM-dependent methyltransferase n=1 Tax=Desulfococcus sp. TaxID=2025834 RepID=UPI0035932064